MKWLFLSITTAVYFMYNKAIRFSKRKIRIMFNETSHH